MKPRHSNSLELKVIQLPSEHRLRSSELERAYSANFWLSDTWEALGFFTRASDEPARLHKEITMRLRSVLEEEKEVRTWTLLTGLSLIGVAVIATCLFVFGLATQHIFYVMSGFGLLVGTMVTLITTFRLSRFNVSES